MYPADLSQGLKRGQTKSISFKGLIVTTRQQIVQYFEDGSDIK